VGDLAAPNGGAIPGHRSHRNGLDADLAFFVLDERGQPLAPSASLPFDRKGEARRDGRRVTFDVARNYTLVEALVADDQAAVQWIFVSTALASRLVAHGRTEKRPARLLERLTSVLHQPSDSAPHDDHFHVRLRCPPEAAGCTDLGQPWSWHPRPGREPGWSDEELVRLALDPWPTATGTPPEQRQEPKMEKRKPAVRRTGRPGRG